VEISCETNTKVTSFDAELWQGQRMFREIEESLQVSCSANMDLCDFGINLKLQQQLILKKNNHLHEDAVSGAEHCL
jgi:hypothetical protein